MGVGVRARPVRDRRRSEAWKITPEIKGAVGFGLVGAIGLFAPQVLGVGYDVIQHVFDGHVGVARALALSVLKPIATSLTLGFGGSGGVFAPSLFTGAMLGDGFGRIAHGLFPAWTASAAAYGLVAMAAVFAAAAEAPITAIVIVFEMSYDYTIVLPLMISTVIATILGRRLIDGTVYELKLMRRGIDWKRVRRPHALERVRVSNVVREAAVTAHASDTVASVAERLHGTSEGVVPVLDRDGRFAGIVAAGDLGWLMTHDAAQPIGAFVKAAAASVASTESLERAADLMADPQIAMLPVLHADGSLAGIITRRDVLTAYRSLSGV